jgi:hypothetical protein
MNLFVVAIPPVGAARRAKINSAEQSRPARFPIVEIVSSPLASS